MCAHNPSTCEAVGLRDDRAAAVTVWRTAAALLDVAAASQPAVDSVRYGM